jgi:hypothetical protein
MEKILNRKYIEHTVLTNLVHKYNDIYWQLKRLENNLYTSICYNQNGFKQFIKDLDKDCYLLANIQEENCFSETRFPKNYPCIVQIWRHFEGSMVYVDVSYSIPLPIQNYSGSIIIKKLENDYFIGIQDEGNERDLNKISEQTFKELLEITK